MFLFIKKNRALLSLLILFFASLAGALMTAAGGKFEFAGWVLFYSAILSPFLLVLSNLLKLNKGKKKT